VVLKRDAKRAQESMYRTGHSVLCSGTFVSILVGKYSLCVLPIVAKMDFVIKRLNSRLNFHSKNVVRCLLMIRKSSLNQMSDAKAANCSSPIIRT